MAKFSDYPIAVDVEGGEEILVAQGPDGARVHRRMRAAQFAAAGTRPTPEELVAAILAALVDSSSVDIIDNGNGTASAQIKASAVLPGAPTAATPASDDVSGRLATTEFVAAIAAELEAAIAARQAPIVEGANVELVDNGDGTFTLNATASSGGLAAGTYGDVQILDDGLGNLTFKLLQAGVDFTVPAEAYGAGWNGDYSPATKHDAYAKLEAMAAATAQKVASSAVGAANGVAPLGSDAKVPAAFLPSYMDDVLEYANFGALPGAGETGKIYVTLDNNRQYRWSGSAYQQLVASPGTTDNVPEGPTNKYYTDVRVRACVATGLVDVVGAPAATDSLLTVLGKLQRQAFTAIPGAYAALAGADFTGTVAAATPNNGTTGGLRLKGNATSGFAYMQVVNSDASAQWGYWRFAASGEAYWSSSLYIQGNITSASDRRLKSDVRPLEGALELVERLDGVRFSMNGAQGLGFIAQDVRGVLPELVSEIAGVGELEGGPMLGVDYSKVVAVLVEAVKELAGRVAELEAR